jgi:hypothetical protein
MAVELSDVLIFVRKTAPIAGGAKLFHDLQTAMK